MGPLQAPGERSLLVKLSEASCVIAVLHILLACVDVSVCECMGSLLSVLPGHPGLLPLVFVHSEGWRPNKPTPGQGFMQTPRGAPWRCHTRAKPSAWLSVLSSSGNIDSYTTASFPARAAKGKPSRWVSVDAPK